MNTEGVSATVREAAAHGTGLRIAGRGSWLDAGRPVKSQQTLSLNDDADVVSYVPGDLTLTVRGGTSLRAIAEVTGEKNQWLPLDPYGSDDGTIGATLATASAGPLSSSFGLARDLVLGIEFVNGRGDIIRGGGKVVKNVAGFDLSRLLTGSWGTLGIITEVTLRLYALPQVDRTFAVELHGNEREVTALLGAIVTSPLTPFAFLLASRTVTRALGLGEQPIALFRLGGNESLVDAQIGALLRIADPREVETSLWSSLRQLDGDAHTAIRISSLPRRFVVTAARILNDDIGGIQTTIDPRRGVMRIVVRSADGGRGDHTAGVVDFSADSSEATSIVFEKLPPDLWSSVSPSVVGDFLSRGIKKAYDPHNILNPGILGD